MRGHAVHQGPGRRTPPERLLALAGRAGGRPLRHRLCGVPERAAGGLVAGRQLARRAAGTVPIGVSRRADTVQHGGARGAWGAAGAAEKAGVASDHSGPLLRRAHRRLSGPVPTRADRGHFRGPCAARLRDDRVAHVMGGPRGVQDGSAGAPTACQQWPHYAYLPITGSAL